MCACKFCSCDNEPFCILFMFILDSDIFSAYMLHPWMSLFRFCIDVDKVTFSVVRVYTSMWVSWDPSIIYYVYVHIMW